MATMDRVKEVQARANQLPTRENMAKRRLGAALADALADALAAGLAAAGLGAGGLGVTASDDGGAGSVLGVSVMCVSGLLSAGSAICVTLLWHGQKIGAIRSTEIFLREDKSSSTVFPGTS